MTKGMRLMQILEQTMMEIEAAQRQIRHETFESLAVDVDAGGLTWDAAIALQRGLGAVIVASVPVNPAVQAVALRKLELDTPPPGHQRNER